MVAHLSGRGSRQRLRARSPPQWRPSPTDVVRYEKPPRRRLIFAGYSRTRWFIYYEHGGRGRHEHVMLFSSVAGEPVSLMGQWTMLPQNAKSLSELGAALGRRSEPARSDRRSRTVD